jgi:hypothetical protein
MYKQEHGVQPIFLTNDIEYISKTMLSIQWVNKHKPIVLEVRISLDETNSKLGRFKNEFVYFSDIEPKYIEVLNMDLKPYVLD